MARGGKREGAGRPKGTYKQEDKRSARLVICCTDEEAIAIKAKAKSLNKSVSELMTEIFLKEYGTEQE